MLTDSELRLYYAERVVPALQRIEQRKKEQDNARQRNLLIALGICAVGTILLLCFVPEVPVWLPIAGSLFILLMVFCASGFSKKEAYTGLFYNVIVPELMEHSKLKYKRKYAIVQREYRNCRLFPEQTDRYGGGDFVSGSNKKTGFAFSYLHTEHREIIRNDDGVREVWTDIFNGMLWIADFNKHFHGITVVLPDNASWFTESWIGHFFEQSYRNGVGRLTKMEDADFEKKFRVFTSDNVEARYILTPSMMQKISRLQQKNMASRFLIAFTESKMFAAFPDMPSPFLYHNEEITLALIRKFYNRVCFFYNLVEYFDLNTRIWTK